MKYSIEIIETLHRIVEIDSDNAEQAIDKAREMYETEDIVLDENDLAKPVEFNVL